MVVEHASNVATSSPTTLSSYRTSGSARRCPPSTIRQTYGMFPMRRVLHRTLRRSKRGLAARHGSRATSGRQRFRPATGQACPPQLGHQRFVGSLWCGILVKTAPVGELCESRAISLTNKKKKNPGGKEKGEKKGKGGERWADFGKFATRRWFYWIPPKGRPRNCVQG